MEEKLIRNFLLKHGVVARDYTGKGVAVGKVIAEDYYLMYELDTSRFYIVNGEEDYYIDDLINVILNSLEQ